MNKKTVKPSAGGEDCGPGGASRSGSEAVAQWWDKVFWVRTPEAVISERRRTIKHLWHGAARPIYIKPAFHCASLPTHLYPDEKLIAFGDCVFTPGDGERGLCLKWPVEIGWRET